MPRRLLVLSLAVLGAATLLAPPHAPPRSTHSEEAGPYPSDWFGLQRAFPADAIPQETYLEAVQRARVEVADGSLTASGALLTWTEAGPTNIGGRVAAIAADPTGNPAYFGAANGGVFRSSDFGDHWTPIFDALGVPSIGALAIRPGNSSVLYVGTGEANTAIDNYDGNGVYRTLDGGASWVHLGLAATGRIARVAVSPTDSNRIYVAAMGRQFSTNPERGLYRTTDGGETWSRTLFVNDSTGACDVVVNPAHPETVFCATWERVRRPSYRRAYGPGCGIWRSTDSGATWTRLLNGLPAPSNNVGRIGLTIAPSRPSMIYAQIMTGAAGGYQGFGFFRSTDGGSSWIRRDVSGFTGGFGGFGWYFGDCAVDPVDTERVWALGVTLMQSTDGGVSFGSGAYGHVDQHAMWISPVDPDLMYLGNDGGVWTSTNAGASWGFPTALPITQFYAGAVDPSNANRLMGGTQDNNSLIRNSTSPGGWSAILGGDGFYCLVDPTNSSIVFAESQNGSGRTGPKRSTTGGSSWSTPSGFVLTDRYNWCTPFVMSPTDHNVMLCGSHRVYRSTNNGAAYAPISGDLTTNPGAPLVDYGTITTLDISAPSPSLYYAGTDDGRVWRTTDGGGLWTEIGAGMPRRWVTRVVADPVSVGVVYVTLSGFTQDEREAHVYRSTNQGATWTSIGAALPNIPANDLIVAPWDPQTLFVGTDVGVYATKNLGQGWFRLGQGMPIQVIHDLSLHAGSRTLVAATHGRSQWTLDLNAMPTAVPEERFAHLSLAAPHPNPARGATHTSLELAAATSVEIAIYDAMGRRVRALENGRLAAGRHAITWDGRDDHGARAHAGVYFLRAVAPGGTAFRRLVRID